jgi:hypothetical protein
MSVVSLLATWAIRLPEEFRKPQPVPPAIALSGASG